MLEAMSEAEHWKCCNLISGRMLPPQLAQGVSFFASTVAIDTPVHFSQP